MHSVDERREKVYIPKYVASMGVFALEIHLWFVFDLASMPAVDVPRTAAHPQSAPPFHDLIQSAIQRNATILMNITKKIENINTIFQFNYFSLWR